MKYWYKKINTIGMQLKRKKGRLLFTLDQVVLKMLMIYMARKLIEEINKWAYKLIRTKLNVWW